MGKELIWSKKIRSITRENVKELKKKTLNDRCAYLARQISKSEEELERKQRILKMTGMAEKQKKRLTIFRPVLQMVIPLCVKLTG